MYGVIPCIHCSSKGFLIEKFDVPISTPSSASPSPSSLRVSPVSVSGEVGPPCASPPATPLTGLLTGIGATTSMRSSSGRRPGKLRNLRPSAVSVHSSQKESGEGKQGKEKGKAWRDLKSEKELREAQKLFDKVFKVRDALPLSSPASVSSGSIASSASTSATSSEPVAKSYTTSTVLPILPALPSPQRLQAPKSAKLAGRRKSNKPRNPPPVPPALPLQQPIPHSLGENITGRGPSRTEEGAREREEREEEEEEQEGQDVDSAHSSRSISRNFQRSKSTVGLNRLKEEEKEEHLVFTAELNSFHTELLQEIQKRRQRREEHEMDVAGAIEAFIARHRANRYRR